MLGPVIEQIASERAGVHGIPYVVLYRDGEAAAEAIGAQPRAALERSLGLEAPPSAAEAAPVAEAA
jgi:thioredoxin-like negative regulator of GroEL